MIQLFVNVYRDPDTARNVELQQAFSLNTAAVSTLAIDGRPTLADMMRRANDRTGDEDVAVIANSDIVVAGLEFNLSKDEAWALTRWDCSPSGVWGVFSDDNGVPRCDSQDAWVFRSPIRQALIDACDFLPGVRGCDNRLAYEIHKSGYKIGNPSLDVRAIHLHRSGVRRYSHKPDDCVPKPYLLIDPHHLGETPKLRFCF